MNLLKLVSGDNFVMYNIDLARATSPAAAAIYSALIRSYQTFASQLVIHEEKEYFYMTAETMEKFTAYKRKPQDRAIKELIEFGLVETTLIGLPAKRHFHITDKIFELFGVQKIKEESKIDQTGQTDNSNDFEQKNALNPLFNQLDQTGQTRTPKRGNTDRPNGATNIKNNIKTKNNLEEEERIKEQAKFYAASILGKLNMSETDAMKIGTILVKQNAGMVTPSAIADGYKDFQNQASTGADIGNVHGYIASCIMNNMKRSKLS
jgi:hypothetical protein